MTKARELSELAHLTSVSGTTATVDGTIVATTFTGDGSSLTGVGTFKPTSVTGATPSLNVGAFNLFDQGTLTANTTVSFASVPTNANWKYTFKGNVLTGYGIENSVRTNKTYTSTQETSYQAIAFSPDGTKMYIVGHANDRVYQYTLSPAWDISTAYYTSKSLSVTATTAEPAGLRLSSDGTKLYVLDSGSSDNICQYTLSTAYDVSTGSYANKSLSVASQSTGPTGIAFSTDGTKVFVSESQTYKVFQYTLSTAWDISTGSYANKFAYVGAQTNQPWALDMSTDGLFMFVAGNASTATYKFTLSTAWDISTASSTSQDNINYGSGITSIFFRPDGSHIYIVDSSFIIREFTTVGAYTSVTLPSSVVQTPPTTITDKRITYEFFTLNGGTTVNLIGEEII